MRAWGPRREDVFAQAARGMLSLVCDPATVTGRERYVVEVEAADESLLLAVWLNELLYLVEGRGLVFSGEFEIGLLDAPVRADDRAPPRSTRAPMRHRRSGATRGTRCSRPT